MSKDDGETLGRAVGTVWKRNGTDRSILPETQRHRLRAAAAQPEVFHLCGVVGIRVGGRVGVGFQPKKPSFLETAERCETGRVGTLRQHTEPIALSILTLYCEGESSSVTCVTLQGGRGVRLFSRIFLPESRVPDQNPRRASMIGLRLPLTPKPHRDHNALKIASPKSSSNHRDATP